MYRFGQALEKAITRVFVFAYHSIFKTEMSGSSVYGLIDGETMNECIPRCIAGLAMVIASSDITFSNKPSSFVCQFLLKLAYKNLHTRRGYISQY